MERKTQPKSSWGSTPKAAASLRIVRRWAGWFSLSRVAIVTGLTPALFANSDCERKRSSLSSLNRFPILSILSRGVIISTTNSFQRLLATLKKDYIFSEKECQTLLTADKDCSRLHIVDKKSPLGGQTPAGMSQGVWP